MVRKEAKRSKVNGGRWKSLLSVLLSGIALIVIAIVIRHHWGPGMAEAQAPNPRTTQRAPQRASTRIEDQSAPQPRATNGPNQVMAVVNTERITRRELAQFCLERFGIDVLETVVNRELIVQECSKKGIQITKGEIDAEIQSLASKFGLGVDQWLSMLSTERDIDPAQYRTEIIWPTLALRKLAADKVVVSETDLQQAMEAEFGERVQVLAISVGTKEKADEVHAKAVQPAADFGKLAREYSEDNNSASVGGIIPPIRRHVGDKNVEQIAFGLRPGEVSPIIPYGGSQYLILKCERRMPAVKLSERELQANRQRLSESIEDTKLRACASELFSQLQSASQVVNVLNDESLSKQYPGVAALINGRSYTLDALSQECLARHGREVLNGEINRRLLLQELRKRNLSVTGDDIEAEVARAAVAYGFVTEDKKPDVEAWLKTVQEEEGVAVNLYVQDTVWPTVALKKLVTHKVAVTPQDIQKAFESNYGERVEVLAIVLDNQRRAQDVWDMARNNPTDQFFGDLANQYSIEAMSKANFGKVPPIRRNGGQPDLEKPAFELKAGELSPIIAIRDKYIILRCLGRTKPVLPQMDEVIRNELYNNVLENKLRVAMADEFQRIHDAAQIHNYLSGESQEGQRTATTAPTGPPNVAPAGPRSAAPAQRTR